MKNIAVVYVVLGVVVAAAAAAWWLFGTSGPTSADANDTVLVAQGQGVYAEHCAGCHGAALEGQPNWRQRRPDGRLPAPPHDESGHTWHHSDEQNFRVTKYGTESVAGPEYKSDMVAFGEVLSDAEIWAVLAYIKSRWPDSIRKRHDEMNARQR